MERQGIIQQIFEATFPNGTTSSGFVEIFQRPAEALIGNYFSESFRVIGETAMSGEVRPIALTASTIIPSSELVQPFVGDSISFIHSLLDDFIREQLASTENLVFGNPAVSGVSVTTSGGDLAIDVVITISSGIAFDSVPELPPQFFDPGNVKLGASLDFTTVSGTEFVMQHDMNTSRFVWDMWTTETTPDCVVRPENVVSSGLNHVIVTLDTPMDGYLNLIGINV